jgi:hypothetical protein
MKFTDQIYGLIILIQADRKANLTGAIMALL